jgi:ABC-type Fe3+-hydroxamate transport system substrate-binding protein
MRVVSLVPSATETLLAWGVEPVAVTRFCEQGDRFTTVGGTKDPNIEGIVALHPDLVVVCDQENRLPDVEAIREAGILVHHIHITHLDHVGPEMQKLAESVLVDPALGTVCGSDQVGVGLNRRRAYIPIWKRPWMTLNEHTYGTSLLASLGIDTVAQGNEKTYPEMTLEEAAALHPDLVIAPDEPYVFGERHRRELETVAPTVFVDGKDLFWWGVRTPDAIARLRVGLAARG